MDHAQTQQPNHEETLQKFFRFLEKSCKTGISGTEHEIAHFCPESDLRDYFAESDHLEGILRCVLPSTGPLPVRPTSIRTHYTKVFAILLCIGRGRFIKHFVKYNSLSDEKLPLDTRPENFPRDFDDVDVHFFQKFYDRQWMFCAPALSYERFKDWQARMILPIVSKEQLGTGGSSVTYRIELHPAYNSLEVNRKTKITSTDPCPNTFVLKTYNAIDAEEQCRKEVEGFVNVRSAICGSREPSIIGFYGSYKHGETWNIMLEYANDKTLEDYFEKHTTPRTGPEIYEFWQSLLSLNKALDGLHNLVFTDNSVRQGWHQDVKPRNILVSTRNGRLEFKLADLGLSHFLDKPGDTVHDWDTQGTRTYGAPECYMHDSISAAIRRRVTPEVDIWSLGCVLSEAAVWLALGPRGLQDYRDLRNENTKEYGIKDSDCFHNGEGILKCVEEYLLRLPVYLRRCDEITQPVLTMIKDSMLVPRHNRRSANVTWWNSSQLLTKSASMKDNNANHFEPLGVSHQTVRSPTSPYPRVHTPEQTATSTSPRKQTVLNGQGQIVLPLSSEVDHQGTISHQVRYPYTQSPEIISNGRSAHISRLSNGSAVEPMTPLHGVTQGTFNAGTLSHSSPVEQGLNRAGSRRQGVSSTGEETFAPFTSQSSAPGLEPYQTEAQLVRAYSGNPSFGHSTNRSVNSRPKEMQPKTSRMVQSSNFTTRQPGTGSKRQEVTSDTVTKAHLTSCADISIDPLHSGNHNVGTEPVSPDTAESSHFGNAVLGSSRILRPKSDHPIDKPRHDPFSPSTFSRKISLPFLSFDEAEGCREQRKKKGLGGLASAFGTFLAGVGDKKSPDDHLTKELEHRDHVFLIDDSTSMREHWEAVIALLEVLAYKVEQWDKNGIDLFFTMSDITCKNQKNTTRIVQVAKEQRPQRVQRGAEHLPNIYDPLSSILRKYQTRLEEEDRRKLRSCRARPWHAHDPKEVRKLNLYIFTDGIWQPETDVVSPIKSLVETLDKFNKPKNQVGIQFIQFGNDKKGSADLSFLDNGLVSSGVARDVVDTEPFDGGNIWKMLLGSVNKWFDDDNGETSGTMHTPPNIPCVPSE